MGLALSSTSLVPMFIHGVLLSVQMVVCVSAKTLHKKGLSLRKEWASHRGKSLLAFDSFKSNPTSMHGP